MKHIHKYRRVNIGQPQIVVDSEGNKKVGPSKEVWVMKCFELNCTHYTRMRSKLSCPLLLGTIAICNKCEEKFILDKRALRMAMPTCSKCVRPKKAEEIKDASEFFESLLEGIGNDIK